MFKSFTLGFIVLAFLANGIFGFSDNRAESLKDAHPAPGQLIDIGGYRLHIHCEGQGSPTVIMDAGLGNPGIVWAYIQPEIAKQTRVCVYDRAGLGWSDTSPYARTANVMVDELNSLLRNADVNGPYVLVGHSFGGMIMRLYAHRFPEEIAGLVLVDSYRYTQMEKNPKMHGKGNLMITLGLEALNLWVASGIPSFFPSLNPKLEMGKLPSHLVNTYQELFAVDPKIAREIQAEVQYLEESSGQEKSENITTLGNIPLIVLAHGYLELNPLELTNQKQHDDSELFWQRDQAELASLSPQGQLIIASESGHYIQLDQPSLVIGAIERVLAKAGYVI